MSDFTLFCVCLFVLGFLIGGFVVLLLTNTPRAGNLRGRVELVSFVITGLVVNLREASADGTITPEEWREIARKTVSDLQDCFKLMNTKPPRE